MYLSLNICDLFLKILVDIVQKFNKVNKLFIKI